MGPSGGGTNCCGGGSLTEQYVGSNVSSSADFKPPKTDVKVF